ncbi:MAG: isochorismatase family protein [Planctomycetota bacterium]
MKKDTLFWDVDTQYDFMRPEGRLYVPGAEGIIDKVSDARRFALAHGYSIIASTDWHKEGNKEISDKPDFESTFPAHCMEGKPGSERVGYLGDVPMDELPNEPVSEGVLQELAAKQEFHIIIRKEELDPFSNPNTKILMEILKPKSVVIFGVALDLCIRQAVEGLLRIGGIKVYLVRDAVKALGLTGEAKVIKEFESKGVNIISLADLERQL